MLSLSPTNVKAGKSVLAFALMGPKEFKGAPEEQPSRTRRKRELGSFVVAALTLKKISMVSIAMMQILARDVGTMFMIHLKMMSRRHRERPYSSNAGRS